MRTKQESRVPWLLLMLILPLLANAGEDTPPAVAPSAEVSNAATAAADLPFGAGYEARQQRAREQQRANAPQRNPGAAPPARPRDTRPLRNRPTRPHDGR